MRKSQIEFEDHGQDFLLWVITEPETNDKFWPVTACEPSQGWLWCQGSVDIDSVVVGQCVTYKNNMNDIFSIKYPVVSIDELVWNQFKTEWVKSAEGLN